MSYKKINRIIVFSIAFIMLLEVNAFAPTDNINPTDYIIQTVFERLRRQLLKVSGGYIYCLSIIIDNYQCPVVSEARGGPPVLSIISRYRDLFPEKSALFNILIPDRAKPFLNKLIISFKKFIEKSE